jgi:hypothetical protein
MNANFGWLVIIGVIGTGGFALWWQGETQVRLHRELGKLREDNLELARLREGNRRLATAQPSATEFDNLRADHAAIPQLRAEIDAMQARVRIAAEKLESRSPDRFAVGSKVLAGDWKNAGSATPRATLETVLWAAAGGDIDTFASCLLLPEGPIRQQATALMESLPAAMREQYDTPERLVAFLAIKDVPFGAAQIMEWSEFTKSASIVQLQLSALDGKTEDLNLLFSSKSAGWKLIVPDGAIAKYSTMLKGPTVAPGVIEIR